MCEEMIGWNRNRGRAWRRWEVGGKISQGGYEKDFLKTVER